MVPGFAKITNFLIASGGNKKTKRGANQNDALVQGTPAEYQLKTHTIIFVGRNNIYRDMSLLNRSFHLDHV